MPALHLQIDVQLSDIMPGNCADEHMQPWYTQLLQAAAKADNLNRRYEIHKHGILKRQDWLLELGQQSIRVSPVSLHILFHTEIQCYTRCWVSSCSAVRSYPVNRARPLQWECISGCEVLQIPKSQHVAQ